MTRETRIVLVLFVLFAIAGVYLLTVPGVTPVASAMLASSTASQRYVKVGGVDTGDCTDSANPCATIAFALSVSIAGSTTVSDTINIFPGNYPQASTLTITKYIILQGTSSDGTAAQIDGEGSKRVIQADAPRLTINNLTIQNGDAGSGLGGGINVSSASEVTIRNSFISNNTAAEGGGIYTNNASSLFIIRSQFGNNTATGASGHGGAIYGGVGASTVITASAVITNHAANGAGIFNQGALTVTNSTLGDNSNTSTSGNGGGIDTTGTTVSLNNVTLFNNSVNGNGGGIFAGGGTVTLQNTILAGNTSGGGSPDCSGAVGSLGFNLIGNNTGCTFTANLNDHLVGTGGSPKDPLLGPLTAAGSYTMYRLPQSSGPTSPAINAGNVTGCTDGQGNLLTVDQRNTVRPQNGRCDIGSVEVGSAPGLTNINPNSALAGSGAFNMTLTGVGFAVTNPQVLWAQNGVTTVFTTTHMYTHTTTVIGLNVPGSAIIFPGTALVSVENPSAPVPNISGALPFTINVNPAQKLIYLPLIRK